MMNILTWNGLTESGPRGRGYKVPVILRNVMAAMGKHLKILFDKTVLPGSKCILASDLAGSQNALSSLRNGAYAIPMARYFGFCWTLDRADLRLHARGPRERSCGEQRNSLSKVLSKIFSFLEKASWEQFLEKTQEVMFKNTQSFRLTVCSPFGE